MDEWERRLPTVCPQLWANEPDPTGSHSTKIVDFEGILSQFRQNTRLRRGFESLQGHP
jgi:hypothetical protein